MGQEAYEKSKNESTNYIGGRSSKEFKSGASSSESPKGKMLSSRPSSNTEDMFNPSSVEQLRKGLKSPPEKPLKIYSTIPIKEEETPDLSPNQDLHQQRQRIATQQVGRRARTRNQTVITGHIYYNNSRDGANPTSPSSFRFKNQS